MANLNDVSGKPGSTNPPAPTIIPGAPAGQGTSTGGAVDTSPAYKELERRLGEQGSELGEYRKFYQQIEPLLTKLDQDPTLAQAIVDGKIDKEIAKALIEGRVDIKDAAAVTVAHEQVKTELGAAKYEGMTPEQIEKLVESKVGQVRKDLEEKSDLKTFEEETVAFIKNTPDFEKYSEEIDSWLNTHDVTDIEVAYYAVKGKMSESEAAKEAEEASAAGAKDVLLNAGGGGQTITHVAASDTALVDKLISNRPSVNSYLGRG